MASRPNGGSGGRPPAPIASTVRRTRAEIYSIDTPPPTASGTLHLGSVESYTHTDLMARFQRMRGKEVFYPMGWDDNGLATERRVQNYFGVRCDPSLADDPQFDIATLERPERAAVPVSRANFIELCERLTAEDEKAFENLFRLLGLSVDWSHTYTTIGERSRRASQRGFLRLFRRGLAYTADAPTMWDVDFKTAVAQAEIEDREIDGDYHRVAFDRDDDGQVVIETHGRSWSPRAWRWWRTLRTSGIGRSSGPPCSRRCSACRCPWSPTSWPTRRRGPASR